MKRLLIWSAVVVLSQLVSLSPAQAAPRCFGKVATIVGTNGNDRINGTNGSDVIAARGGHDLIGGQGGKDFVCAGGGDDEVGGDAGKDKVNGQGGDDLVFGGGGNDLLLGGGSFNVLVGNAGNDKLIGGSSMDFLFGQAGNDLLDGRGGIFDRVIFVFSPGGVTVNLTLGQASGADGTDTIREVEDVEGSRFNDVLTGNDLLNFIFPLDGNDTVDGGPGEDLVSFDGATGPVTMTMTSGTGPGEGSDTFVNMEALQGSEFGDFLDGDALPNVLIGRGGNDDIEGFEGDDILDGGEGTDVGNGGPHTTTSPGDRCISIETPTDCESLARQRDGSEAGRPGAPLLRHAEARTSPSWLFG
jgi:Ca2+-binding RTX toxin-like protein